DKVAVRPVPLHKRFYKNLREELYTPGQVLDWLLPRFSRVRLEHPEVFEVERDFYRLNSSYLERTRNLVLINYPMRKPFQGGIKGRTDFFTYIFPTRSTIFYKRPLKRHALITRISPRYRVTSGYHPLRPDEALAAHMEATRYSDNYLAGLRP